MHLLEIITGFLKRLLLSDANRSSYQLISHHHTSLSDKLDLMSCAGQCKQQVFRINGRLTDVSKSHDYYPDLTADDRTAILQRALAPLYPTIRSKGMSSDCECIRIEGEEEKWSYPVRHILTEIIRFQNEECIYELYGTYEVQTSIFVGYCMKKSNISDETVRDRMALEVSSAT